MLVQEEAAKAGDPKSPLLQLSGSVERAHTERLAVTKTRLDMFDKLKEEGAAFTRSYRCWASPLTCCYPRAHL